MNGIWARAKTCALLTLLFLVSKSWAWQDEAKTSFQPEDTLRNATSVIQQMMTSHTIGIPRNVLDQSECVVVVPGRTRKLDPAAKKIPGTFTCRAGNDWSAPSFIRLESPGNSFGEAGDFVLFVKAKSSLSVDSFRLGQQVAVAPGPVEGLDLNFNWVSNTGILAYSGTDGLFSGADLTGAKWKYDRASVASLYGKRISAVEFIGGRVHTPSGSATDFKTAVADSSSPFKWPPLPASATEVIPRSFVEGSSTQRSLGDLNTRLTDVLDKTGYHERAYFIIPGGFALVTRFEQIDSEGKSQPEPCRFLDAPQAADGFWVSLWRRTQEFFGADNSCPSPYYRIIMFIVSDVAFTQSGSPPLFGQAKDWLHGLNTLPLDLAAKHYTEACVMTALIYEFEREPGKDPKLDQPSRLGSHAHLVKSGIWGAFAIP